MYSRMQDYTLKKLNFLSSQAGRVTTQGDATIAPPPGAAAVFPKDNNNQPMSQNPERWPSAGQCRRSLHQRKNWLCLVTGMIILQRSMCSSINGCRSPPSACNTQREAPLPSLVMEERRAQTALCGGLGQTDFSVKSSLKRPSHHSRLADVILLNRLSWRHATLGFEKVSTLFFIFHGYLKFLSTPF